MVTGVVRWIDLPSTDLEKSCAFYEEAFGWKITRSESWPDYPMWSDSEDRVGGGFDKGLKPMGEAGIFLFILVESIEDALKSVVAAGGKVAQDKKLISESVGWWASFLDPSGNLLGLWERPPRS